MGAQAQRNTPTANGHTRSDATDRVQVRRAATLRPAEYRFYRVLFVTEARQEMRAHVPPLAGERPGSRAQRSCLPVPGTISARAAWRRASTVNTPTSLPPASRPSSGQRYMARLPMSCSRQMPRCAARNRSLVVSSTGLRAVIQTVRWDSLLASACWHRRTRGGRYLERGTRMQEVTSDGMREEKGWSMMRHVGGVVFINKWANKPMNMEKKRHANTAAVRSGDSR